MLFCTDSFFFRCGSCPDSGTGIFVVRVLATGLPVTPPITTYQDTAERSADTQWCNGNGQHVVMVGALVRILTAVVFLSFFKIFFLTKLKQVLVLRVLGLGSRLQEVRLDRRSKQGGSGRTSYLRV